MNLSEDVAACLWQASSNDRSIDKAERSAGCLIPLEKLSCGKIQC